MWYRSEGYKHTRLEGQCLFLISFPSIRTSRGFYGTWEKRMLREGNGLTLFTGRGGSENTIIPIQGKSRLNVVIPPPPKKKKIVPFTSAVY